MQAERVERLRGAAPDAHGLLPVPQGPHYGRGAGAARGGARRGLPIQSSGASSQKIPGKWPKMAVFEGGEGAGLAHHRAPPDAAVVRAFLGHVLCGFWVCVAAETVQSVVSTLTEAAAASAVGLNPFFSCGLPHSPLPPSTRCPLLPCPPRAAATECRHCLYVSVSVFVSVSVSVSLSLSLSPFLPAPSSTLRRTLSH